MIFEEKKKYIAPEMDVIDMECRTILCDSGNSDQEVIDIIDDDAENSTEN